MSHFAIKKTIWIDVEPKVLFGALTSSDEIVRYFPLRRVTSDWKEGAEILFEGDINGKGFRDYGIIQELSPPTCFRYTYWSDNHGTERIPENHMTIAYDLSPEQRGTRLDLEHSNFPSEEMFSSMDLVWDSLLSSLRKYLENRR